MTAGAAAPAGAVHGATAIADVEITAALPSLDVAPGVERVRALLRLHGEPVGQVVVPVSRGIAHVAPALAAAVRRGGADGIAQALARRAVEVPADETGDPVGSLWTGRRVSGGPLASVTVAICTRDRPRGVERLLASLRGAIGDGVEVLVIDNAPSTTATRDLVARVAGVRYLREGRAGLDHARNCALREARADVVAFADDDVVVDPAWHTVVQRTFGSNPELTLLTGLVEPLALETQAERWFEAYGGFGRGYEPRWIHASRSPDEAIAFSLANTGRFGTGANLAVRRDDALRLGAFDPALDVGTPTRGGGDLEMMFRVLKGGGVLAYTAEAMVRHAHRRSTDELEQQIESWGSGMVAHLTRTARAHEEERVQVAALRGWLFTTWFLRRLATSYVRAPFPRGLIVQELRGSWRGAERYEEAARHHTPPPRTPRLHAVAPRGMPVRTDLRLGERLERVAVAGSALAEFRVHLYGRPLGALMLPVVGGTVGATRLRDAIAVRWQRELLGGDPHEVRRRIARQVEQMGDG